MSELNFLDFDTICRACLGKINNPSESLSAHETTIFGEKSLVEMYKSCSNITVSVYLIMTILNVCKVGITKTFIIIENFFLNF